MNWKEKITGRTKSGFDFSVDAAAMDNMELIDAIADLQSGDTLASSRVCRLLLDAEQRKALYDHIRGEDGRVPVEMVMKELVEMVQAFGSAGKNASSSPA